MAISDDLKAALYLCQKTLAHRTGSLSKQLLELAPGEPSTDCLPQMVIQTLAQAKALEEARESIEGIGKLGIETLCILDPDFPPSIKALEDPPLLLFLRGNRECLTNQKALAIVGSRKADPAGCEIAHQFALGLASHGICIVSGLALGIDGAAHRGALKSFSQTPTIAVLGNGLPEIYPRGHDALAREILSAGGLIISQFLPHEPAYPANFLNRNRLIAALSEGVLVIQASKRSGSLVTARYALEQGKELLAVPGSILEERYQGSNDLIKQGAFLVTSAEDVMDIFEHYKVVQPLSDGITAVVVNASSAQQSILSKLVERESWSYEELERSVDCSDFLTELYDLEMQGLIVRLPGNILTRAPKL